MSRRAFFSTTEIGAILEPIIGDKHAKRGKFAKKSPNSSLRRSPRHSPEVKRTGYGNIVCNYANNEGGQSFCIHTSDITQILTAKLNNKDHPWALLINYAEPLTEKEMKGKVMFVPKEEDLTMSQKDSLKALLETQVPQDVTVVSVNGLNKEFKIITFTSAKHRDIFLNKVREGKRVNSYMEDFSLDVGRSIRENQNEIILSRRALKGNYTHAYNFYDRYRD